MTPEALRGTDRTTLRRHRERGDYDRALAYEILDEALICHVGFNTGGSPFVTPMTFARVGDALYLHGAVGNRMLRALADGTPACVEVTLLDGLVLARSAFHHSMNYRSVMLFAVPERVDDLDEKRTAVAALLEHMVPGRSLDARGPTEAELTATLFLRFAIDEGSAKVRRGPPLDDEEDMELGVWAGVVPFERLVRAPLPDAQLPSGVALPEYLARYAEGKPSR
ncbi:MAG TPA: pyridoxamine 5'-phosphate oxidase family protein [Acidimicrobiales bacterium]|nr:pyridoxamine 5'-phosphate oxidase family protein [Acidimicrobiales bacterium]